MEPRVVLVTRPTAYEELLAAHGTHRQAAWYLERQGQQLDALKTAQDRRDAAVAKVIGAIPRGWRQTRVGRRDLDRFLFEPEDVVIPVGPDGLVANVAKYVRQQVVLGVNPDPAAIDGVLAPHPADAVADLLADLAAGRARIRLRTMVEATTDDGQVLRALNEVFVGHRSHQSARYTLRAFGRTERQSSSGLIVATGTGATGWAASIARVAAPTVALPGPTDPVVLLLVREAWPSRTTGVTLGGGRVEAGAVEVVSEMDDGGVAFGDGIEQDAIPLPFARRVTIGRAADGLAWVA